MRVAVVCFACLCWSLPAEAKQSIATRLPCAIIKEAVTYVGLAVAEQEALRRGYTQAEIDNAKKRCRL